MVVASVPPAAKLPHPRRAVAHLRALLAERTLLLSLGLGLAIWSGSASAQRANENAAVSAEDAFGVSVGSDQIGLYSPANVRGFSPETAGNIRIEGLSVTEHGGLTGRVVSGSVMRVGITAQNYPFPAPTGIADFTLRIAGEHPLLSAVGTVGPLENRQIDLDGQVPIIAGRLSLAAGMTGHITQNYRSGHSNTISAGGVLHWQPASNVDVKPFYGRIETWDDHASTPLYLSAGPFLPPRIPRNYVPRRWGAGRSSVEMAGTIASVNLSANWSIKAGLFRWRQSARHSFQDIYAGVQPDGSARRLLVASHDQEAASTSGEIRSAWTINDGPRRHVFILNAKGRTTDRTFGGADVVDLGSADIFRTADPAKPALAFGALNHDRVTQLTPGIGYQFAWRGWGGLSLNVQKPRYRKKTLTALSPTAIISRDSPWLFSGSAIVTPTRSLAIYAGYTTGLEEGAAAPANAVNRTSPTPALRTSQHDLGLRYRIGESLTFLAGVFDVRKPYFSLDSGSVYRQLGEERHRGVELSLTGRLTKDLTIVSGAVLSDARVTGDSVASGIIGPKPLGSTPRNLLLSLEWRPPRMRSLSLRVAAENSGRTIATGRTFASLGGRQVTVPQTTSIDFSGRYRFRVAGHDASFRLEARNLLNSGEWSVASDSAFTFAGPRRIWSVLSIDV